MPEARHVYAAPPHILDGTRVRKEALQSAFPDINSKQMEHSLSLLPAHGTVGVRRLLLAIVSTFES
jgi:hypothetical protein